MKKTKLTRKASSIIVFIVAIAIIVGLLVWLITTLISEASNLLQNINTYIDSAYNFFNNFIAKFDLSKIKIPEEVMGIIQNSGAEFLETATEWAKRALTNTINFITSVPTVGVYIRNKSYCLIFYLC